MMMGKSPVNSSPKPNSIDSDMNSDSDESQDDDKDSKMMAMQNLLDGLSDLVSDDMKPYINKAKQAMSLSDDSQNENMESSGEKPPAKSGLDVSIGMGADKSPQDENDSNPKGFLAILAKRMKNK